MTSGDEKGIVFPVKLKLHGESFLIEEFNWGKSPD